MRRADYGRELSSYVVGILPGIAWRLTGWRRRAGSIPEPALKTQALASIQTKSFHCYGGAVLALGAKQAWRDGILDFITAFQTISDYLDNLCDRMSDRSEQRFLQLHRAMQEAGNPDLPLTEAYYMTENPAETVYLRKLVRCCRSRLSALPGRPLVQAEMDRLITYYAHLQAYKHLDDAVRSDCLIAYLNEEVPNPSGLYWWELAAATGSTLGMFALAAAASDARLTQQTVERLTGSYFPWICAAHILFDYLIDLEEDRQHGDLNFVEMYPDQQTRRERLTLIYGQALSLAGREPSREHQLAVNGLAAMYFSDRKASSPEIRHLTEEMLAANGPEGAKLFKLCRAVRRVALF
ncbi:MAG: DUF2600 family protein [Solirubrobacterales bacterium]